MMPVRDGQREVAIDLASQLDPGLLVQKSATFSRPVAFAYVAARARLAERALERKQKVDDRRTIVVGLNAFRRPADPEATGEVFTLDPQFT